ncbi:hypothetical protein [Alteromonas sp. ASW11-130]|nr:hypothetical protein [Alteromonas sp. ASW11-130]MCW8090709.1 hypothetical protein [Alteromonas sp. ASW11-130]
MVNLAGDEGEETVHHDLFGRGLIGFTLEECGGAHGSWSDI